jgi:hypothetical protein
MVLMFSPPSLHRLPTGGKNPPARRQFATVVIAPSGS